MTRNTPSSPRPASTRAATPAKRLFSAYAASFFLPFVHGFLGGRYTDDLSCRPKKRAPSGTVHALPSVRGREDAEVVGCHRGRRVLRCWVWYFDEPDSVVTGEGLGRATRR